MVTMSKEYAQEYYKKNKEYFKEKQTAKMHCNICNKEVSKWNYQKHCKTKGHLRNANETRDEDIPMLKYLKTIQDELVNIRNLVK